MMLVRAMMVLVDVAVVVAGVLAWRGRGERSRWP